MQTHPNKVAMEIKYTTVHIPNALAILIDKLIDGRFRLLKPFRIHKRCYKKIPRISQPLPAIGPVAGKI